MAVKVQAIDTPAGERWLLLDDGYTPIAEANSFLKSLDARGYSPNTMRSYAYGLKWYWEYMEARGVGLDDVFGGPGSPTFLDLLTDFALWAGGRYDSNIVHLGGQPPAASESSLGMALTAVTAMYRRRAASLGADLPGDGGLPTRKGATGFLSELVGSRRAAPRVPGRPRRNAPGEPEHVTRAQLYELEALCTCARDRFLLDLMFNAGLRVGEALGMRLCDVRLEDGRADVVPRRDNPNGARAKSGVARQAFPPRCTLDLARDYIVGERLAFGGDMLFVNLRGPNAGRPLRYATVSALFARLSEAAGYRVHPHMLRHGFAVERLEDGMSAEDISLMLGHRTLSSTRTYLAVTERLARERLRPEVERAASSGGGR